MPEKVKVADLLRVNKAGLVTMEVFGEVVSCTPLPASGKLSGDEDASDGIVTDPALGPRAIGE